jgi:hypothetical protein
MSIAELEVKKARLARRILNEKDENIIVFLGENLRKMKHTAIDTPKRKKLVNEFFRFVEVNSITDSDFKFNREDCYDRQIFLR